MAWFENASVHFYFTNRTVKLLGGEEIEVSVNYDHPSYGGKFVAMKWTEFDKTHWLYIQLPMGTEIGIDCQDIVMIEKFS